MLLKEKKINIFVQKIILLLKRNFDFFRIKKITVGFKNIILLIASKMAENINSADNAWNQEETVDEDESQSTSNTMDARFVL